MDANPQPDTPSGLPASFEDWLRQRHSGEQNPWHSTDVRTDQTSTFWTHRAWTSIERRASVAERYWGDALDPEGYFDA
jgi:hypothetical protein